MHDTVQHNKCVICSKLVISRFLSTLEIRKIAVGCVLLPGNSILHICNKNWLYITTPVPSSCFKGYLNKHFPLLVQVSNKSFEVMK